MNFWASKMKVKYWIRRLWYLSWLVTIPLCWFGNVWISSSLGKYDDFVVRHDIEPLATSLGAVAEFEYAHAIRKLKLAMKPQYILEQSKQESTLKVIDVFLSQPSRARLNSNLPHSGFEYVDGAVLNNGSFDKVSMRYRGDHAYHWMYHKKSLRVKTKKSKLYKGVRKFNLIANKSALQLRNYPGYVLTGYLGNIGPNAEMLRVRVNGRSRGTYTFVEQLDESTLRRAGVMPGDLFAGELVSKDQFTGIRPDLFLQPGLWEKVAVNNHFDESASYSLDILALLVASSEEENSQIKLQRLLDVDEWGRFMAFETISQSFHYGPSHNWRLYFDPATSKFVPVVWDPVSWGFLSNKGIEPDIIRTRIHSTLLQNAPFIAARARHIAGFYARGDHIRMLADIDETIAQLNIANSFDPDVWPYRDEEVAAHMSRYRKKAKFEMDGVGNAYNPEACAGEFSKLNSKTVRVRLDGRCAFDGMFFKLAGEASITPEVTLTYESISDGKHEYDLSDRLTNEKNTLTLDMTFIADYQLTDKKARKSNRDGLTVKSATYDFKFSSPIASRLESVSTKTGEHMLGLNQIDSIPARAIHIMGLVDTSYSRQVEVWSGVVEFAESRVIRHPIKIEAGADLRLAEGVSILIEGRVTAIGNVDAPIQIRPSEASVGPWGTFAILSEKANGSELDFVEMSGGSGLKRDLYEYSAMLSIHDVKDVSIQNSTFRDNSIVDDMVHFVYSDVAISDSKFLRSNLDALDADISRIKIVDTEFIDSGNDALDLMTTKAEVERVKLVRSRDKGISVGEDSDLDVVDSVFEENEIGLQAKDSSVARLTNVQMRRNRLAVDAYKKNWRYDAGGRVVLTNSRFDKNIIDLTKDKHSSISIEGTTDASAVKKR